MRRAGAVLAGVILFGCSGGGAVETTEAVAGTIEATVVTTEASVEPTEAAEETSSTETSEPWDLVWFSDSTGWGVADLWAERLAEELGVEVRVHDYAAGNLSAGLIRTWIETEGSVHRESVAEAEVIVIFGNPIGSGATSDIGTCVSTSTAPRDPPQHYTAGDFLPYRDVLVSIWETVFDLRKGQPTIFRAIDMYNPVIADHREAGIEAECIAAWEAFSQTIREAAAEFGVPTASMFDAFNGPNHDEDPREKGFIGSDKQHTTDQGKAAMVEVLHGLGYDPTNP
jgi:hypothetical protein